MSDCMTQEDAERMDANQAVQILKPLQAMMIDQHGCPISDAYFALDKAIEALKQPAVNVVPVVRCEDCDYYEETDSKVGTCLLTNCGAFPNGYCSWAERREDETTN